MVKSTKLKQRTGRSGIHRSKSERSSLNKARKEYRKQGRETSHRLNARTDKYCRTG